MLTQQNYWGASHTSCCSPNFFCTFSNILGDITYIGKSSTVCYHSATQSPQFDVSFPEKLLKIVNATRGETFSLLKFTKYRLAAGLCPDPVGELSAHSDPLAAIRGPTSKGREREERGGEGRGGERMEW